MTIQRASILRAVAALLVLTVPAMAQTTTRQWDDRTTVFVAETPMFAFHSDPLMNLHDFLLWRAISPTPIEPREACTDALPAAARRGWEEAGRYYAANLRGSNPRQSGLPVAIRYRLAGFPAVRIIPDSVLQPVLDLLRDALPVYRSCWWADHDARNRAWVAALLPRLRMHEDTLRARLAKLWQAPWGGRIPVDVAGYASFGGANTVADPDHIIVSAANDGYRGDAGVEMMFHEASHTVVGNGQDIITRALRDTSVVRGHRPSRDLPHILLFYTVGRTMQRRLAETGTPGYEPYVYKQGLFARSWPAYPTPLEQLWQPYLDGKIEAKAAIRNLLDAIR